MRSASCAVTKTSGTPPASTRSRRSGHGRAVALVDDEHLGLRPAADDPEDPVADRERRDPVAERGDLAGELHAGDVRWDAGRRGVEPGPLREVGPVEPGAVDPDLHLARTGLGRGTVRDLDRTVAGEHHRSHEGDASGSALRPLRAGPGATGARTGGRLRPMAELTFVDDDGERVELDADDAAGLLEITGGLEAATVSACPDCRSRVRRGRRARRPAGRGAAAPAGERPARAGRGRADAAPLRRRRRGRRATTGPGATRDTRSGSTRCLPRIRRRAVPDSGRGPLRRRWREARRTTRAGSRRAPRGR